MDGPLELPLSRTILLLLVLFMINARVCMVWGVGVGVGVAGCGGKGVARMIGIELSERKLPVTIFLLYSSFGRNLDWSPCQLEETAMGL